MQTIKQFIKQRLAVVLALCIMLGCVTPALAVTASPIGDAVLEPQETTPDGFVYKVEYDHVCITDYTGSAEHVTVPAEIAGLPVTSIQYYGTSAFRNCTTLKSITLPAGISYLEASSFYGCTNLQRIYVDEGNQKYADIDGVLFSKDATRLICFPDGRSGSYTVPDGVKRIESVAFYSNRNVMSITVPSGVNKIGNAAFAGCSNLVRVTFPYSVELEEGPYFSGCQKLAAIKLPSTTTNIDYHAFQDCSSLEWIELPPSVTTIAYCAFTDCTSLTDVYYPGTEDQWSNIDFQYDGAGNQPLLNATIHFNSVAPAYPPLPDIPEPEVPTEPTEPEPTEPEPTTPPVPEDNRLVLNQHPFGYYSGGEVSYRFDYNERWFFEDNKSYKHDLAKMSVRVALAAARQSDKSITALYDTLGFDYVNKVNELKADPQSSQDSVFYPTPTTDSIGYAIGSKEIHDGNGQSITLVVAAVRGAGYEAEWSSNVKIGLSDVHQGFDEAADQVLKGIQQHVKSLGNPSNVRVWVVGYSRAAATANIVAKQLNSNSIPGLTNDEVYAYCFACPRNVRSTSPSYMSAYPYINNIVNPIDLVPMVAPEAWDYERYGTTLYLPSNEFNYADYDAAFAKMLAEYRYIKAVTQYDGSLADDATDFSMFQYSLFNSLVDSIAFIMMDPTTYFISWQDMMRELMNGVTTPAEAVAGVIGIAAIANHPKMLLLAPMLINVGDHVTDAHQLELYMAWLDSMDGTLEIPTGAPRTRYLKVNCPVDISVYDSEGKLVAQIIDDVVQEIEGSTIGAYIDENGQKIVVLPADETFHTEVTATGDGTMSYQIEEHELERGAARLVNYYDIPIEEGDRLTGIVSSGEDEAEYAVFDQNEEQIDVSSELTDDQIAEHLIQVAAEGNGTVSGGGVYLAGEYAVVRAEAEKGHEFCGWYADGELLSNESEYRFRVERETELIGQFREKVYLNPFTDVPEDSFYYTPVLWALEEGITSGTEPNEFSPYDSCLRSQVVAFLWRAAGKPQPNSKVNPFEDVKPADYYYNAVLWAVENGITYGADDTHFEPNGVCNRSQVVSFLYRAFKKPPVEGASNPFKDVPAGAWYAAPVLWAVKEGIAFGLSSSKFGPNEVCNRSQVVTFLYRAYVD